VRTVPVVVRDIFDDEAFELLLVPDDGAVEEFSADRADPSFGEGVGDWGADGGLEDLEAFGSEDLVEGVDELAASVADQSASTTELAGVVEEQVAGCLGVQELGPGLLGTFRRGLDVVVAKDLPHRRLCDLAAEADEFAVDSSVAPCRILGARRRRRRWAAVRLGGAIPGAGGAER